MSEKAKFILKVGVLGYGVPMFVISLFIERGLHWRTLSQVIFALLWLSGGALFGLVIWNGRSSQNRKNQKPSSV
jgi:hypothetical protein